MASNKEDPFSTMSAGFQEMAKYFDGINKQMATMATKDQMEKVSKQVKEVKEQFDISQKQTTRQMVESEARLNKKIEQTKEQFMNSIVQTREDRRELKSSLNTKIEESNKIYLRQIKSIKQKLLHFEKKIKELKESKDYTLINIEQKFKIIMDEISEIKKKLKQVKLDINNQQQELRNVNSANVLLRISNIERYLIQLEENMLQKATLQTKMMRYNCCQYSQCVIMNQDVTSVAMRVENLKTIVNDQVNQFQKERKQLKDIIKIREKQVFLSKKQIHQLEEKMKNQSSGIVMLSQENQTEELEEEPKSQKRKGEKKQNFSK